MPTPASMSKTTIRPFRSSSPSNCSGESPHQGQPGSALPDHELVVVPEDETIARADREGLAPIDVSEETPGVRAVLGLAERLVG